MYDITQTDFRLIREEAFDPAPGGNAFAVTFDVTEKMFPGYLYARRNTFPCEEDIRDCLITAQMQIIKTLRRYFFEREDMEQTPKALQSWMFTVLKNCHFTVLRKNETGRKILQKLEETAETELGITRTGEGRLSLDGTEGDPVYDGGFHTVYEAAELEEQRQLLTQCFTEILTGRSDVQIILAWLSVRVRMLLTNSSQKDAIARLEQQDPTMKDLLLQLVSAMGTLPWTGITKEDFLPLAEKLNRTREDGRRVGDLKFGDFTTQSVREYISKSINKRDDTLNDKLKGVSDAI